MRVTSCFAACALVWALGGCTSDHFDYGTKPSGPTTSCTQDECPPECPLGTARGASGQCEPVCGAWQQGLDIAKPAAIALTASRIVAVGTFSDGDGRPGAGVVWPASLCSGALDDGSQPFGPATSADASADNGKSVFLAGMISDDASSHAGLLELDAASLTAKPLVSLAGPPNASEVLDAAANATGAWVVGSSATAPWLAHVASGQAPCVRALTGTGEARAVAALDDGAVVIANRTNELELQRFDDASCAPPACGCNTAFVSPKLSFPGAQTTTAADVALSGRTALIVGYAQAGSAETFGFVLAVNIDSGAVEGSAKLDPGPDADALYAVSISDKLLFAAGMTGTTSGHAVVAAWSLPLASDAAPSSTWVVSGASRAVAIATQSPSLYVLGATPAGHAVLRRCDQAGGC